MPKTNITVKLVCSDGNAFAVMGTVSRALKHGGHSELVEPFMKEAMSGDYDHLLQTVIEYVEIE